MGASATGGGLGSHPDTVARLQGLLEPLLAAADVDLEQVEVAAAGRRQVLRIVVDRDGGIDLDAVADVSRIVGSALDEAGSMGEAPYVLEVTSPGVDRPLTGPTHWRRAKGRLVRAVLRDGSVVTGRVHAADDTGVDLRVGERSEARRLDFAEVARAQIQIEFAAAGAEGD